MTIFQIIAICALVICKITLLFHFIRIVKLGAPKDLSQKSGSVSKGVIYANTTSMLPQHKESAYMHLPTYSAGILFHIGTFSALFIFVLSLFPFFNPLLQFLNRWLQCEMIVQYIIAGFMAITTFCGIMLFIKRIMSKSLKVLSNADDYISNGLTTLFQLMTVLFLVFPAQDKIVAVYYIIIALLLLYLPFGKLKHALYYFAARYHLGFFYGWRNVWPPKK